MESFREVLVQMLHKYHPLHQVAAPMYGRDSFFDIFDSDLWMDGACFVMLPEFCSTLVLARLDLLHSFGGVPSNPGSYDFGFC